MFSNTKYRQLLVLAFQKPENIDRVLRRAAPPILPRCAMVTGHTR
jgi:hypothetical protein